MWCNMCENRWMIVTEEPVQPVLMCVQCATELSELCEPFCIRCGELNGAEGKVCELCEKEGVLEKGQYSKPKGAK